MWKQEVNISINAMENLIRLSLKIHVFWSVMCHCASSSPCFKGSQCLLLQGQVIHSAYTSYTG